MHVAPLFNSQPRLLYLVKPQKQMPLTLSPLPSGTSNGPKPMQPIGVRFLGQKAEWRKVESGPKVALADIQHIKFPKTCFCLSLHCAKFSDINICLLALVSQLLPSPENLQEFSWNLYSFMFLPPPKLPKETQFFGLRQFNYTSFPFEFFHLLFQYLA